MKIYIIYKTKNETLEFELNDFITMMQMIVDDNDILMCIQRLYLNRKLVIGEKELEMIIKND